MAENAHVSPGTRNIECYGALLVLFISLLALGFAPLLMPASYSMVENTTSESAAQGIDGAWLARLGFLLFGFGAIWTTHIAGRAWGIAGRILLIGFGVLMTTVAAFASKPWDAGQPYNSTEDLLHSVGATGVGFAFAVGVACVTFQAGFSKPPRLFGVIAIAAAAVLPLGMSFFPGVAGILQRLMFLIAYLWFGVEAWKARSQAESRFNSRNGAGIHPS